MNPLNSRDFTQSDDPDALFQNWLAEAKATEINDPEAMALATVDSDGLPDALPADLASAHAMILAQREMLAQREAALSEAEPRAKTRALEIERLKLQLAKARHERYGQSSERGKLFVE